MYPESWSSWLIREGAVERRGRYVLVLSVIEQRVRVVIINFANGCVEGGEEIK